MELAGFGPDPTSFRCSICRKHRGTALAFEPAIGVRVWFFTKQNARFGGSHLFRGNASSLVEKVP